MDKKQPYRIVASGKKAERRDYEKLVDIWNCRIWLKFRRILLSGSRTKELEKFSMKSTRFKTMEEISS